MLPPYAELHCLSNFSFLRGASHPEELVERAQAQGYTALALTDECSVAGVVRGHLAAKEAALHFVIGSEFTLADGLKLALYATDRASYGDLAQLITRGRRNAAKGSYALTRADVNYWLARPSYSLRSQGNPFTAELQLAAQYAGVTVPEQQQWIVGGVGNLHNPALEHRPPDKRPPTRRE